MIGILRTHDAARRRGRRRHPDGHARPGPPEPPGRSGHALFPPGRLRKRSSDSRSWERGASASLRAVAQTVAALEGRRPLAALLPNLGDEAARETTRIRRRASARQGSTVAAATAPRDEYNEQQGALKREHAAASPASATPSPDRSADVRPQHRRDRLLQAVPRRSPRQPRPRLRRLRPRPHEPLQHPQGRSAGLIPTRPIREARTSPSGTSREPVHGPPPRPGDPRTTRRLPPAPHHEPRNDLVNDKEKHDARHPHRHGAAEPGLARHPRLHPRGGPRRRRPRRCHRHRQGGRIQGPDGGHGLRFRRVHRVDRGGRQAEPDLSGPGRPPLGRPVPRRRQGPLPSAPGARTSSCTSSASCPGPATTTRASAFSSSSSAPATTPSPSPRSCCPTRISNPRQRPAPPGENT